VKNHIEPVEGVRIVEHRSEGFPSFVALPEGIDETEVLLCGHLDVVIQPQPEAYAPKVQDGRIYGTGAGDMKGQVAALLELFREMHLRHPGISLGLVVTTDEEIGGEHGIRYLVDEVGLRSALVVIPDGGFPNEVVVEEKGAVHLGVHVHGQAGHGARPWLSDNPLEKLMDRLCRLRDHFETLKTKSDDHWYPTCTATVLKTQNETANRMPEIAAGALDIRFPPPHSTEGILGTVQGILGDDVETHVLMAAEPTHLAPDPLFGSTAEELTGRPVTYVREAGGSDARFFCRHGIPVIMSRPLVGNLHADDEWMDVESLVTFYRIYERYLVRRLVETV